MHTPILHCDDGSEIELPSKIILCSGCDGRGKSSAYLGAFSREELDNEGPDFQDDYFSGRLDRPCERCGGEGRIAVADRTKMTAQQRKAYNDQCRDERDLRAEEESERRFGC